MSRSRYFSFAILSLAALSARPVFADDQAQAIYDKVTPSLVAVQFTYAGDTMQEDLIVPGIVVSDTGLVMFPMAIVNEALPDEQMTKFKIIIPHADRDDDEVDAVFQGRDERSDVAFVKAAPVKVPAEKKLSAAPATTGSATTGPATMPAAEASKPETKEPIKWTPIKFVTGKEKIGDTVYSVGMSPKSGGYHTFLTKSVISSMLRGPVKQVMVSGGGLASPFAPVLDTAGDAIGYVSVTNAGELLLDDTRAGGQQMQQMRMLDALQTNKFFVPTAEFEQSLKDPPTDKTPIPLAYIGLAEMSGLSKSDAALFGLEGKTVVQINDMLPDCPAEKAGLKKKDVIVKVDGQPLERGDLPDEAALILSRKLRRKQPGDVVTFTVVDAKDKPSHDVKVTMAAEPRRANQAGRYWNDEIGFGVREMVLFDRYGLKLKPDMKDGVLVTELKQGGSAGNAGLRPNDMIIKVNDEPVTSLEQFKSVYEDFRKAHEHEAIVLAVYRFGGKNETIRIEPPQ
jgi:S1-C subfamily serine protease